MKKYLKKYTRLEYLPDVLRTKSLHLGVPETWSDKNDAYAIRLAGWNDPRATCLTKSKDRYHFWEIFGGCDNGVCLWFSDEALWRDIARDKTLIIKDVLYPENKDMERDFKEVGSPAFLKRPQYADEREVRVIRISPSDPIDKFQFSRTSLRKIYLNPWLHGDLCTLWRSYIRNRLKELGYPEVEVKQNRSTNYLEWQKRLDDVASAVSKS